MTEKDKKLKTNQMMKVEIPNFGIIEIGHKTEMGKVSQVIDMGNSRRKLKGLREIELREILAKQDLWEFIIARNTLDFKYPDSGDFINGGFIDVSKHTVDNNKITICSNFKELEQYKESLKPAQNKHLQVKTVKYGQATL